MKNENIVAVLFVFFRSTSVPLDSDLTSFFSKTYIMNKAQIQQRLRHFYNVITEVSNEMESITREISTVIEDNERLRDLLKEAEEERQRLRELLKAYKEGGDTVFNFFEGSQYVEKLEEMS